MKTKIRDYIVSAVKWMGYERVTIKRDGRIIGSNPVPAFTRGDTQVWASLAALKADVRKFS